MRETQPVESVVESGTGNIGTKRVDNHPAFGVAVVTRASGTPRSLFQSDLRHNETINLTIHSAERGRELHHDWVYRHKTLIDVEMSLAQWGALVSSIGLGSGVPVTIRYTETLGPVPDLPYEPRIAESVAETKETVAKMLDGVKSSYEAVLKAFESKAGVKAMREAINGLGRAVDYAPGNAEFAIKSVARAAEDVTSQAKADIESHILNAQRALGVQASIEAPSFQQEIEQ